MDFNHKDKHHHHHHNIVIKLTLHAREKMQSRGRNEIDIEKIVNNPIQTFYDRNKERYKRWVL
jgi:hypothetical protein